MGLKFHSITILTHQIINTKFQISLPNSYLFIKRHTGLALKERKI